MDELILETARPGGICHKRVYAGLKLQGKVVIQQSFLDGKVVVERTSSDVGSLGDLLHRDCVKPVALEKVKRNLGEQVGGLAPFSLPAPTRRLM